METWKTIEAYPDYEVSTAGRVRRITATNRAAAGSEPKPCISKKGYLRVALYRDSKRTYESVHKLVAQAFLENPLSLPTVNHKHEPKTNNAVENLEWASYVRQMRHAQQTGLRKVKGYTFDASRPRPWVAQLETGGRKHRKSKKLGYFATEQEARAAYEKAVSQLEVTL